ncbi:unnamed protein product [Polarella glacialis]|uniref:Phosphoribulokinase, chloroplastic n=2 Tax=Polarella glacialis TaxID=89957 RepID=A0A813L1V0_POLGL|nr:unnamed protein product [Polarella glacialis]
MAPPPAASSARPVRRSGARPRPSGASPLLGLGLLAAFLLSLRSASLGFGVKPGGPGPRRLGARRLSSGLQAEAQGLLWPSAEAQEKLRSEDGVSLLPTHRWEEDMHPIVPAVKGWDSPPMMIGIAVDGGCGATTFLNRLLLVLGMDVGMVVTADHTPVGDLATVVNIDDYRVNDRAGCEALGHTEADLTENDLDLLRAQLSALKQGKAIYKPVYNHITGLKDIPERVEPNALMIFEGLHPFADESLRRALDLSIYIDIPATMKFFWKARRDVEERFWTTEQLKADIERTKSAFAQFVEPQKRNADLILVYEPSEARGLPYLNVKLIQKKHGAFTPVSLTKEVLLAGPVAGRLRSYDDDWFGSPVTVLEMDGEFDHVDIDYDDEVREVEEHLLNLAFQWPGQLTEIMKQQRKIGLPGCLDGTGLFQTIIAMQTRGLYDHELPA